MSLKIESFLFVSQILSAFLGRVFTAAVATAVAAAKSVDMGLLSFNTCSLAQLAIAANSDLSHSSESFVR